MGTHEVFEVINTFNENELLPSLSKGSGTVTANIPREISIDSPSEVFAEFYGSVDLGFLTLKIQDHLNNDLWFVDPGSVKYEYDKDTGKNIDKGLLSFRNDRYSSKWKFNIQQELKTLKPGKGLATLGMFEIKDYKDKSGVLIRDRPHVDLVIEEIQLI